MSEILNIVKQAIRDSAYRKPFHDKWLDYIEYKDSKVIMRGMGYREDINGDILEALESAGYKAAFTKKPLGIVCGSIEYYTLIEVSQTA